jgi:hypothetical protein
MQEYGVEIELEVDDAKDDPAAAQLLADQVAADQGRAATQGHDPGGDVGSLAAGADHGVPVDVGIRLDQAVEPHDHVQQDVADHADPQTRRRDGLGLPHLTEAARVHLWPWPGRWPGRGRAR